MPRLGYIALLCIAGTMSTLCQTSSKSRQSTARPPSTVSSPPSSCTFRIVHLTQATGSLPYRRLKYQIEALEAGQEAVETLEHAHKEVQESSDITSLLEAMLPSTDKAKDDYDCAAYLIQKAPTDPDNKVFLTLLVHAYIAEGEVLTDLVASTKEQLLRNSEPTKEQQVHDAERSAGRTKKQNEASSDILHATTYSLIFALDLSDKNAKTTEYVAMTCAEKSDLEAAVEDLAGKPESAFTVPASIVKEFLTKHKCRA
jgi:hypothetical protein